MRSMRRFSMNFPYRFHLHPRWTLYALICCLSLGVYVSGALTVKSAHATNAVQKTQPNRPAAVKTFDINTEYGTLAFRGAVERTELRDEYEFLAQIELTFLPGEVRNGYTVTNRTNVADLHSCQLVATIWSGNKEPAEVLYREAYPIEIRLAQYGETAWLPDLKFRLPKSIAARATHIGLGVTDGNLLWPIAVELK